MKAEKKAVAFTGPFSRLENILFWINYQSTVLKLPLVKLSFLSHRNGLNYFKPKNHKL
jgi:hypothetical protein